MPPYHVLIVEDDSKLSRLYGKILNHAGYETRRVTTVDDALFHIKKFDPDVICLDWHLGDQLAEALLAYIAAFEEAQHPRVVLVSGKILRRNALTFTGYVHLIDVVMLKPAVLSNLVMTVKKLTDSTHAKRKQRYHVSVTTLGPEVVQIIWEGRVGKDMLEALSKPEVLKAKAVIFDVTAAHLHADPLAGLPIEKWKANLPTNLYLVHHHDEAALVRVALGLLIEPTNCHFYSDRELAMKQALADVFDQENPTKPSRKQEQPTDPPKPSQT